MSIRVRSALSSARLIPPVIAPFPFLSAKRLLEKWDRVAVVGAEEIQHHFVKTFGICTYGSTLVCLPAQHQVRKIALPCPLAGMGWMDEIGLCWLWWCWSVVVVVVVGGGGAG